MGKNNYNINPEEIRQKLVRLGDDRALAEDIINRERAFWRELFIADAKMEIEKENEKKKKKKKGK